MPNSLSTSPARPAIFWLASLALLVTAVVLLRDVLLPFVTGLALAYLLDPLVSRLERLGIYRGAATLLILALFFAGVILLLLLALPVLIGEISLLIEKLPGYIKMLQALAVDPSHPSISKAIGAGIEQAERSSGELASVGASWLSDFVRALWSDGRMLLSIFSLLVVTPIITAYLVYDWSRIIATVDRLIPASNRDTVRALVREIDGTVAGFLHGQATICLMLGVFYALALRGIGLNHGLLIGAVSGLLGFVPYFGCLTGLLLSLGVAIAQFGLTWTPIVLVFAIFLVGQSLSDYVFAPYFVGNRVHLNPVWLMFALFSFGYLFGFVGLLIAVPLAASIGVLVRFALRQQQPTSAIDGVAPKREPGVDLGKRLGEQALP